MTKQLVWDKEEICFEGSIDAAILMLHKLKDEYGSEAYIGCDGHGESWDYVINFRREETEREEKLRLKAEERLRIAAEKEKLKKDEKDRKEYERLKKKFGGE